MTQEHPAAQAPRTSTPLDAIADGFVASYAQLSPSFASAVGIPGYDGLTDDLSVQGYGQRHDLAKATLDSLATADTVDDVDAVTLAAMRERLGLQVELFEAGEVMSALNNIASEVQGLRDVYDNMPTDTVDQWANIASRMAKLPWAMDGLMESLSYEAARGNVAAIRQVTECARQARELAAEDSFFTSFVAGASAVDQGQGVGPALQADLDDAAEKAREAYSKLAHFLEQDLAPQAPQADAVGRERYARASRYFLGAQVDLDETYEWGIEELARVVARQTQVAAEIAGPGASVEDAVAALDANPAYTLHGTDQLKAWMQKTSDEAIANLSGTHFVIEGPSRVCECMIAPTQTGGIYYTPPSDDFSRPGRMWWSVPPGVTEFQTWREKTTVYHEGVPGHHLQCAAAVAAKDTLNSWRRLMSWCSGHGEGWALYAEQLMADLGYMDDPGDMLGMLDGQRLRATRVVFDIGMHLGKKAPAAWGGQVWTPEVAWDFLSANVAMNEGFRRFEFNRYLGWPGQAPSYKIGQRLWEQIRDADQAAAAASGKAWDAKAFHTRALNLGGVPLDVLRTAMAA